MKKQNFVIGIPCKDSIDANVVDFLVKNKIQNVITEKGYRVVKNRNKITKKFLNDYKEDYLIYLDNDVVPNMKLIEMAIQSKLDVINIPYPIYNNNGLVVTCLNIDSNKWYDCEEYSQLVEEGKYKFKETQIAGAGCLIVHRKVLKKLDEPKWEHPPEQNVIGEDILFCYNICKKGFSVFSLVGALCDHYKAGVNLSDLIKTIQPKSKKIPKIIHQIWTGSKEVPYKKYREELKKKHPDWKYILWNKERLLKENIISKTTFDYLVQNLKKPVVHKNTPNCYKLRDIRDPFIKISDISRYNILKKYGGVYVDVDIICLKPLDDLLLGNEFFAGFEGDKRASGLIGNAVIGSIPNHPVMIGCVDEIKTFSDKEIAKGVAWKMTGPILLTSEMTKSNNVTVFKSGLFYPISFRQQTKEKLKNINNFKGCYLIHPWGLEYDE